MESCQKIPHPFNSPLCSEALQIPNRFSVLYSPSYLNKRCDPVNNLRGYLDTSPKMQHPKAKPLPETLQPPTLTLSIPKSFEPLTEYSGSSRASPAGPHPSCPRRGTWRRGHPRRGAAPGAEGRAQARGAAGAADVDVVSADCDVCAPPDRRLTTGTGRRARNRLCPVRPWSVEPGK